MFLAFGLYFCTFGMLRERNGHAGAGGVRHIQLGRGAVFGLAHSRIPYFAIPLPIRPFSHTTLEIVIYDDANSIR